MTPDAARTRLDVWLFRARFASSRSVAAAMVERGQVRLERSGQIIRVTKPAYGVLPGDILTLPLKAGPLRIEICAAGHRRGPPAEARTLWRPCDIAGA